MSVVISVENVSKEYRLGKVVEDSILESFRNINKPKTDRELFFALKNVNFDLSNGEVLGIIGRNGAGKSTLLKVLSRITYPTSGSIKIKGKIASLLEVGTGFHPELSGRENIFLNGAILGMKRSEIKRKFDEIVDFSGVKKFIDTPVKHYSSGMYVRLAFSVAAHLEPEILIIDEVLAVGDAEFQKKCLGKMRDVAGHGRTVIFVSHNMAAVENLCSRAILLEQGEILLNDDPKEVIESYYRNNSQSKNSKDFSLSTHNGEEVQLKKMTVSSRKEEISPLFSGSDCHFTLHFYCNGTVKLNIRISIYNGNNDLLFICNNYHSVSSISINKGKFLIRCIVEDLPLYAGIYRVDIAVFNDKELIISEEGVLQMEVGQADFFKTGKLSDRKLGLILQRNSWEVKQIG